MVQNPFHFGTAEVRIQHQTGFLLECVGQALLTQLIAQRRRTTILPHNRIVNRLAGFTIPHHHRFALIRDANRRDIARADVRDAQRLQHHTALRTPNFIRIVFHPTRIRKNLGKFLLRDRTDIARMVKHNRTAAGSALIQGQNKLLIAIHL